MHILPIGGRIKSASVGLNHLYAPGVDVDQEITRLRRDPLPEMSMAFFPRTGHELKRVLKGIGFFRPTLKTDQGMAGNFLPFFIDPNLERTDLSVRRIAYEEGLAIPEPWMIDRINGHWLNPPRDYKENWERIDEVQRSFLNLNLEATYHMIEEMEVRRAEKGRLPFFFIRPAMPDRPIVIGQDIVQKVEASVRTFLEATGFSRNLIYCQPDVFLLTDGSVVVERINCPDVGMFFSRNNPKVGDVFSAYVHVDGSAILPTVQKIVEETRDVVVERIIEMMGKSITIVTRDEVRANDEDVLECGEIRAIGQGLMFRGARVRVVGVSQVASLEVGSRLLLLNLNWRRNDRAMSALLWRRNKGEVECFPDPYLQMMCERASGLPEVEIAPTNPHRASFLQLAASRPSSEVRQRLLHLIEKKGITGDIIHAVLASETIPIFRQSLHSWRHFAIRAARPENKDGNILLRSIPARPDNLLLTSTTGPRLHAFRFMCVA